MENKTLRTENSSDTVPDDDIIFSAIKGVEQKEKERPDIEWICAVLKEWYGLAKEDEMEIIK